MKKVYIVASDEILLRAEKIAELRKEAEKLNYPQPSRFVLGEEAEHRNILSEINNPSLFSPLTMLLVTCHQLPLNKEAEKLLEQAAASINEDILLIISMPRLSPALRKKKWFKELEKQGEYIALYPPDGAKLGSWIAQRAKQKKLNLSAECIEFLAQNSEGNLNGAVQELEKLSLSYGEQQIGYDEVRQAVGDSSYYEIFALSDSMLAGDVGRCRRVLQRLKYLKEAPSTINWILVKDIHMLIEISGRPSISDQELYKFGCFGARRSLARNAAHRFAGKQTGKLFSLLRLAAMVDRAAKGGSADDCWQLMEGLSLRLAGLITPAAISYLRVPAS